MDTPACIGRIHSNYSTIPGYYDQMVKAHGENKAQAILGENRHNTVYFPNIMIKGPIQLLRVFTPLAANKTLVDSYIYRLVGRTGHAAGAHRHV